MQCAQCQHENREAAAFCEQCGAELALACAKCGEKLRAEARFCDRCGERVAEADSSLPKEPASPPPGPPSPSPSPTVTLDQSAEPEKTPQIEVAGGRYKIQKFLGSGAAKRVYLAVDLQLDREVAVSLIDTQNFDEVGKSRIERETKAMAALGDHANIVTIYDVGDENGRIYIVSQYMAGGELTDRMQSGQDNRVPPADALQLADQICSGLQYAHERDIVHRDLKPGNVWLDVKGEASIGDFGLAVSSANTRLTQEGVIVGTVAYLPPEQAMGRPSDPRSDLYSLGVMLYEMTTGKRPFTGDDAMAIISQHINTPPVAPSFHNPEIGTALDTLILDLLAKVPENRPPSASAVRDRIQEIGALSSGFEPSAPTQSHGISDLVSGRFVGRADELKRLQEHIDEAVADRSTMTMVVGEPGIGKTRLVEEASVYMRLRGGRVLWGRCHETEAGLPYHPFIEALQQYVRERSSQALRTELGEAASDVAKLLPELKRSLTNLGDAPKSDPEQERYRLFEGIATFLVNAARSSPIVLVLDDLHWADKPSLLMLQHLAREARQTRLLIVGTYRDVDLDRRHPLSEMLAELRRERLYDRVRLSGLTNNEVTGLLEVMTQQDMGAPGQAIARAIHQESEGNPFFIEEIMRHLVETGVFYRKEGQWTSDAASISEMGIPEGIREVIGRRLSRLSEETNEVLSHAAILGRGFEFAVLEKMVGIDGDALLEAVEEALKARMISEATGQETATYAFTHALIRQTLDEEMSLPRKQRLHMTAAEAIEQVHERHLDSYYSPLASHFRKAGTAADPQKTVNYCEKAGDAAAVVLAWEDAASHWTAGLEIMREHGSDVRRRARLLERLADVRYISTDMQASNEIRILEEALQLYEQLEDERRIARTHSRLGRSL